MSVVIETLVYCDSCGDNGDGDDRSLKAAQIRKDRKSLGWIQIGHKDYCEKCAHQARLNNKLIILANSLIQKHGFS